MQFEHRHEAETSIKALDEELQLKFIFCGKPYPAALNIRGKNAKGKFTWFLSPQISSMACTVPGNMEVTYLTPTSQLGMDCVAFLAKHYCRMKARSRTLIDGKDEPSANGKAKAEKGRKK